MATADADSDVHHETRGEHARRMGSRAKLYLSLLLLAALVLVIVLLALDNRNDAQLSWVVGDTTAPVVWIVLASALRRLARGHRHAHARSAADRAPH